MNLVREPSIGGESRYAPHHICELGAKRVARIGDAEATDNQHEGLKVAGLGKAALQSQLAVNGTDGRLRPRPGAAGR
jgi:hypothetical protein